MQLRAITLRNIRSYKEETVEFPSGITLLSGDIGSGKTSILLGVEFALFGIIRGSFSGSSLLRHGTDNGSVTLSFTVSGKDVTVHRSLKRSSRGVRQDTGWYEIDGDREDATAREIKATVIALLGYPASLVTKSKSMLYRYTVYTPQEEMKGILRESADDRLEKIRKVLHLDKYKRVKENASEYARTLKREVNRKEKDLPDEDELVEKKEEYRTEQDKLDEKIQALESKLDERKEDLDDVKASLEEYEEARDQLQSIDKKLEAKRSEVSTLQDAVRSAKKTVGRKQEDLVDIEEPSRGDLPDKDIVEEKLEKVDESIQTLQDRRGDLRQRRSVLESKKEDAAEVIEEINGLDTCPTCGQDVDEEHKKHVRTEQQEVIDEADEELNSVEEKLNSVENKLAEHEEKQEKLRKTRDAIKEFEQQVKIYEKKQERNEDLKEDVQNLLEQVEDKQDKIATLQEDIESLEEKRSSYDDLEDEVNALKEQREDLEEARQEVASKLASVRQRREHLVDKLDDLNDEIDEVQEAKKDIQQRRTTYTWLNDHFTNVLDVIEKHVLLNVQQRFNESFRSFFNDLIEDEALLADIDNEFTPRITQQGYEMDVEDLSGGEKTSVALAYRLAMNDVINDYMHQVRTDDLIVLDEPTDGFSGEQLDRLRDILHGLRASQIILVSHEEKLEGVTENLIRVRKANNKSQVTS